MNPVLKGIKILDLSVGIAGPMATMALSDQGADVIRIEIGEEDVFAGSLSYRVWQRGKRSAVFNLNDAKSMAEFKTLVSTADVLVESFSPGKTDALGIDYASLREDNPALIYCSITGYGRNNPLSQRPAIDALVAARTGLHFEQRGRVGAVHYASGAKAPFEDFEFNPDGVVGPRHHDRDGPLFNGVYWPSVGASYAALTAISAALFVRSKTGLGQWVETSLLQGVLTAGTLAYSYAEKPDAPHFATWINDSRSPKGNFECKDGRWIINWVPNPGFILGASEGETLNASPDMSARQDPDRIMPAMDDMLVLDHYYPKLAEAFQRFDADQWVDAGAVAGQCIQKVRSPEESLNDPDFLNDGCVAEIEDAVLGRTRQVGLLYSLSDNPGCVRSGIAQSGQHTEEVLREAKLAPKPEFRTDDGVTSDQPLAGIKVLDLGLAIAGPFGAQVLSDLGAEVIKVNATYDWFWHSNAIAMSANRGKRSIAVNMRDPRGVDIIRKLAAESDVLIHNMRQKAVSSKGLDFETLHKENPRLIYCHTRGFDKGPRANLPGNDQTGSALTGVQWEDGACAEGGRPYWSLTTLGDTGNGYLAAIGIMQALTAREETGKGQFIDTSIVNAHLFNCSHILAPSGSGRFDRSQLSADGLGMSALYRLYQTADQYLCIAVETPSQWLAFAKVLEIDNSTNSKSDDVALVNRLKEKFKSTDAATWFALLDAAGVPCEIADSDFSKRMWQGDSFLKDRHWLARFPHPVAGELGHVGVAYDLTMTMTPARAKSRPLIVGESTREILADLGVSSEDQAALFADQVVADESCYMYDLDLGENK